MVEPPPQQVPATIISPEGAADVDELFSAGQTSLRQGEPERAALTFDRILEHDPEGPLAARALFQSALAHEADGDLEGAAVRFEQVERRYPGTERSVDALIRALRVRLHLEQWPAAGELGAHYLERYPQGPVLGRLLGYAARSLSSLAAQRNDEAEYFAAKGLGIVDALALDRAGRIPRDLAVLYFASGEARRSRAEQARLSGDVREFAARLEQRCQLLLSAQSAYSDAMRAYDAHWSTIAGYRVAELYERLHGELMEIPMPRDGSPRQRLLFEGAMRLRYSVLLGKATAMIEHTLAMAARTGESSEWVRRSERARDALAAQEVKEREALARLPFTREDLQRALDDLATRAAAQGASKPRREGRE